MAKYLIVETCYEYNDEYYNKTDGYNIKSKLYSEDQLGQAQEEVDRLNKEKSEDEWFRDWNDEPLMPFKIIKIEE
jgi:hypothetical protein